MKPGVWPDLPRMLRTVKEAGYTPWPEKTELRVTGRVVQAGERFALELEGMKEAVTIRLVLPETPTNPAASLVRRVSERVELDGIWLPAAPGEPGPGALRVITIR